MTWFLPILCSIFSDCPGLSLFALNNNYQSISSNQVSVFLFLTKKSPRFLMTKSFLSFHADKYFTQKNIIVKKNKFETINQQCSPKATNKITPNLGNVIWVGRKKNKINSIQSFYQY